MNLTEIPSLSAYLDTLLTVDVVPGRVTNSKNNLYVPISIPSKDYAFLTADDLNLMYLRPMVQALALRINALGNVKVKASKLPGKKDKVIGFRCMNGKIPVRVCIARRPNPDRHMIIVDVLVQPETEV